MCIGLEHGQALKIRLNFHSIAPCLMDAFHVREYRNKMGTLQEKGTLGS
jgi:hypothetical protein